MSNQLTSFAGLTRNKRGTKDFEFSPISTGYSSMNGGNISIDPSIRNLQQESYGRLGEGVTRYLGDIDALRGRFTANEGAYTQARVNPILQARERRRGEITRGLGVRGLAGSTFQDQAVTSSDLDYNRAESDARAMAERESVDALSGLDQNRLGAVGMYSEAGQQMARDRLQQELAALGLGQNQIQQRLSAWDKDQNREQIAFAQQMQNWFKHSEETRNWINTVMNMKGGGNMGCYIAAFNFGPWTVEHFLIAKHVHTSNTWRAKAARFIYKMLKPLFNQLLKEARHA